MKLIIVRTDPFREGYQLAYCVEDEVYDVLRDDQAVRLGLSDNEPQGLRKATWRLRRARSAPVDLWHTKTREPRG